jgi:chitinase
VKIKIIKNITVIALCFLLCLFLLINIINITKPSDSYAQEQTPTYRSVSYFGDWSVWGGQGNFYPQNIPGDKLTHLNYAFLDFDANGNLKFTDKDAAIETNLGQQGVTYGDINAGILPALLQLRANFPNLKIGFSLGGWTRSGDFAFVAADATKRANLVNNCVKFVEYLNFDFIDVDWEYPCSVRQPDTVDNSADEGTPNASPADKQNFILLLSELKNALNILEYKTDKEYELSVALSASINTIAAGIDVPSLYKIIDFANIMTYDSRGAWDTITGHQSGLYINSKDTYAANNKLSIDDTIIYLIEKGANASKTVIGCAFYTRGWGNVDAISPDPDSNAPGMYKNAGISGKDADSSDSRGAINEADIVAGSGGRRAGNWAYRKIGDLKEIYPNLTEYYDEVAEAAYLYDSTEGVLFTYDNVRSITAKLNYVKTKGLGGIISWQISNDKPSNESSEIRDELTKAIYEGLFGNNLLPEYDVMHYTYTDLSVVLTDIVEYGINKIEIKIVNKSTKDETNEVLASLEEINESVLLPKIFIKIDDATITGTDYRGGGNVVYNNGYYEIDLSTVYDAKVLPQGATYTFIINLSSQSTQGIKEIKLQQRITPSGPYTSQQPIYGIYSNKRIITFECNGGNEIPNKTRYYTLNIKEPVPTKKGYNFNGWYTENTLQNQYSFTTMPDNDLSLYADWNTINYNIVYNIDGGVNGINPDTYTIETPEFSLNNPSKDNYRFLGWRLDEQLKKDADTTIETGSTGDLVFYADWILNSNYRVKLHFNDENYTYKDVVGGSVVSLPNSFEGYEVDGWFTDIQFTQPYVLTNTVNNDLDLYALLIKNNYSIYYETNGGNEIDNAVFDYGDTINLPNNPKKIGYIFSGWFTDENLSEKFIGGTMPANNLTLYAGWTERGNISDFDVGFGIDWPDYYFAPFVDVTAWTDMVSDFSLNGVLDITKVYQNTGIKLYNFGFINTMSSDTIIGKYGTMLNWSFGGYDSLSEHGSGGSQYEAIKTLISNIRAAGGDVTISIGGLNENNFFQFSTDIDVLTNTYLDIVYGFGLTRLDLDIEGGAQRSTANAINAQALKNVQELTGVEIVLTLPVLPTGLTADALYTLNAYLSAGVDIAMVNIMTMCYGDATLLQGENYGQASLRAMISLKNQLIERYNTLLGITLSEQDAYKKTGTTISIGLESEDFPIYTKEWAQLMYDFAVENGVGMLTYWSLNRDVKANDNIGVNEVYEFANVYKNYGNDPEDMFSITFNSNGGSAIDEIKALKGSVISEPDVPTKKGYTFAGWYADANFTNAYVFSTMPENNITLYAKWSLETYTIKYYSDGVEINHNPMNYNIETETFAINNKDKEGYTFEGWYSDSNFTTLADTDIEKGSTGNLVFYAKWIKKDDGISSGTIIGIIAVSVVAGSACAFGIFYIIAKKKGINLFIHKK